MNHDSHIQSTIEHCYDELFLIHDMDEEPTTDEEIRAAVLLEDCEEALYWTKGPDGGTV